MGTEAGWTESTPDEAPLWSNGQSWTSLCFLVSLEDKNLNFRLTSNDQQPVWGQYLFGQILQLGLVDTARVMVGDSVTGSPKLSKDELCGTAATEPRLDGAVMFSSSVHPTGRMKYSGLCYDSLSRRESYSRWLPPSDSRGAITCPFNQRAHGNMVAICSSPSSTYSESTIPWWTVPKELQGEREMGV